MIRIKPSDRRVEDEAQAHRCTALKVVAFVDILIHVVYIALLAILSREYVLIAVHAAGLAVILVAYAAYRRGLYGEGVAMLILLCEVGALSVAWISIFGFSALVYCHTLCFIIPSQIIGIVSTRVFRAMCAVIFGFAAAFIAIGLAVSPTADGAYTSVYAVATIVTLCAMRSLDSIIDRKHTMRSIARYEKSVAGAKDESMRDPLTSLWNRRYLDYRSENYEFMSSTTPCTVAMLDLDWFKNVNDTYSHMVGDQMLLYFSMFLKENLRASDHIVRWGGEEFLIIFTNTDAAQAFAVLNNLREDFKAAPMPYGDSFIPMTFTAGLSQLVDGMSMQSAIEKADTLLYAGKAAGRDRVVAS